MRKNKSYFFFGVDGITNNRFRTQNLPDRPSYEHLFDSVPFILDVADTAKELESGHIKTETDTRARGREVPHTDGFSRAVLAHQLPVVKNLLGVTDSVVSTSTNEGITISVVTYVDPISGRNRTDYVVESGLTLTSSDASLVISPIANGFDIIVAAGLANDYKVMGDAADPSPNYLDAKVGNGLTVDFTHRIVPVIDPMDTNISLSVGIAGFSAQVDIANTNTIQLVNVLGHLTANVIYNPIWFTETALGLEIVPNSITSNEIANNTILGTDFNANAFGDGIVLGASYAYASVDMSLELFGASPNKVITLVNDSATPGNKYYYGTNNIGLKGWYAMDNPIWAHYIGSDDVYVLNTNSRSKAPTSVATGDYSKPYMQSALGNAMSNGSQVLRFMMNTNTDNADDTYFITADGSYFWLPENSIAHIQGTVIAVNGSTGDANSYQFVVTAKRNSSAAITLSEVLYLDETTPFFVAQAGSSPYATEYEQDMPDLDMRIEADTGINERLNFIVNGDGSDPITWSMELRVHLLGYADFEIPDYSVKGY